MIVLQIQYTNQKSDLNEIFKLSRLNKKYLIVLI
jgi:hypothetical protein